MIKESLSDLVKAMEKVSQAEAEISKLDSLLKTQVMLAKEAAHHYMEEPKKKMALLHSAADMDSFREHLLHTAREILVDPDDKRTAKTMNNLVKKIAQLKEIMVEKDPKHIKVINNERKFIMILYVACFEWTGTDRFPWKIGQCNKGWNIFPTDNNWQGRS
jgi:hypothetical protein